MWTASTGAITRVSHRPDGSELSSPVVSAQISADGTEVFFATSSSLYRRTPAGVVVELDVPLCCDGSIERIVEIDLSPIGSSFAPGLVHVASSFPSGAADSIFGIEVGSNSVALISNGDPGLELVRQVSDQYGDVRWVGASASGDPVVTTFTFNAGEFLFDTLPRDATVLGYQEPVTSDYETFFFYNRVVDGRTETVRQSAGFGLPVVLADTWAQVSTLAGVFVGEVVSYDGNSVIGSFQRLGDPKAQIVRVTLP